MNSESSLAEVVLKRKGADDPAGDDRGGDSGNSGSGTSGGGGSGGHDDGMLSSSVTSASSSSSSASSSSSSSSSTSSASSASSAGSSASTSSSNDDSSASSSTSSASSSASHSSSASSASNSTSNDDSPSSTTASGSSAGSSASSAASSSASGSTGDDSSSATAGSSSSSSSVSGSSSAASGSASASHSNDDGAPEYGHHSHFLFDAAAYLALNPDLLSTISLSSALQHFLTRGGQEDRDPTRWFDADFYRSHNADLSAGSFDDATLFEHYNLYGVWEGRAPSAALAAFDGEKYLRDNPDVAAYVNAHLSDFLGSVDNGAIAHFMIYGAHEGRAGFDDSGHHIDPGLFAG